MNESETRLLNSKLAEFPSFGEFDLYKKLISYKIYTVKDRHWGWRPIIIFNHHLPVWEDILVDFGFFRNERIHILDFLTQNGFAIKLEKLDMTGHTIQLTELGRRLKSAGSVQNYKNSEGEINPVVDFLISAYVRICWATSIVIVVFLALSILRAVL